MTNFPDVFSVKNLSLEGKRRVLKKLIFLEILFQKMTKSKFRKTAKTYRRSESNGFSEPDQTGNIFRNFLKFLCASYRNV